MLPDNEENDIEIVEEDRLNSCWKSPPISVYSISNTDSTHTLTICGNTTPSSQPKGNRKEDKELGNLIKQKIAIEEVAKKCAKEEAAVEAAAEQTDEKQHEKEESLQQIKE
eukprot:12893902-Ditylum_brightwellii.AAC.1